MVYVITGFSDDPKYHPVFRAVNEDGSPFEYKNILSPEGGPLIWNLDLGYRLTEDGNPPHDSVYQFAKLAQGHRTKILPNIFALPGPVPCVDQAVRDCIESLEPNIHQFFQITLLNTRGEKFDGNYFILNVCTLLDSLDLSRSNIEIEWLDEDIFHVTGLEKPEIRTLDSSKIRSYHLWREKMCRTEIYISDNFFSLFHQKKFKGVTSYHFVKVNVH